MADAEDSNREHVAAEVEETVNSPESLKKLEDAKLLYASYFFAAWGDRMWEFAAVVFLLEIFPDTLLPASLFGFCESVSGIVFGPSVGDFIDQHERLPVIRRSILGQNVTICLASLLFAYAIYDLSAWTDAGKWFVVVLIIAAGMVAKLASTMNKVSIHKDWAVVVSGKVSCVQTAINANMRRVDMVCSICAPLFVGVASAVIKPAATCLIIAVWAACSMYVEYQLSQRVYDAVPGLAVKPPRDPNEPDIHDSPAAKAPKANPVAVYMQRQTSIMRQFWHHRAFAVAVPYALLYMSVLSLHGTMVSYLRTLGVADFWLAFGRALGALVAIGSTYAVPVMVARMGLIRTGVSTLWVQIFCLTPLFLAFVILSSDWDAQHNIAFIVTIFASTATSRFGLWGFDLAQTQLMQELVEHEYAGAVNGAQETIVNVCYLVSYGYTMVFSDPRHFIWPVVFSYLSILASGVLFTRYWRVTGDATPQIPHRASSPTSGGEILPLATTATTTTTTTATKQQGGHHVRRRSSSSGGGVTAGGGDATDGATAVEMQQGPHAAATGGAADEGAHSV